MATNSTSKLQRVHNYYDKLFPYRFVLEFLSHKGAWKLEHREMSLVVALANEQTSVIRHRSVTSEAEWRAILAMNDRFVQLDVGACYHVKPSILHELKGKIALAEAVYRRELTFDIDLSEYKDVRYCCGDSKKCCSKCWPLAICAALFMESILRNVFACENLVWFYSGRRGIHCWVYDEKYAALQPDYRLAMLNYIRKEKETIRVGQAIPTHVQIAITQCLALYKSYVAEQRLLSDKTRFVEFAVGLDFPQKFVETWTKSSLDTQDAFEGILELEKTARKSLRTEMMLKCIYPRLDEAVTHDTSHLIKMPFSIHPATGLVCMPLTIDEMRKFTPEAAEQTIHIAVCTQETVERGIESAKRMLRSE